MYVTLIWEGGCKGPCWPVGAAWLVAAGAEVAGALLPAQPLSLHMPDPRLAECNDIVLTQENLPS